MSDNEGKYKDSNKHENYKGKDNKYTEKDAARDTKSSQKEVEHAWHDARDDAMKSGELEERAKNKASKDNKGK